jgi:hypothetical protein
VMLLPFLRTQRFSAEIDMNCLKNKDHIHLYSQTCLNQSLNKPESCRRGLGVMVFNATFNNISVIS